jgi:outer membrane protein OmpA-like peptidoglycan-associated protein
MFPGVTRNGVSSSNGSSGLGFRVAAAAINANQDSADRVKPSGTAADGLVDSQGRPIQAPIATTLKSAGRVQVYINFVTDSADLQASSGTVLNELLAALTANPKLRIDLIGHTDAVGGSAHNQELSERRAAAVYLWLTQHGVARERLRSSGRGFLEPIAANDTAEGKALNRRVEVKAVN